ncbi:EamA family transporter, partial [Patescibacteria group bacterium]|nr:EamA family transporter [Patescibacteria group bacterium]
PSVLLLPLLMKQPIKRIKKTWEKYHTNMFFSVASDAGGLLLMTSALRIGSASKVLTVHQSMMIVGVLAGILLLKETKMIWRKVVGSLITLIGLWMLIY